LRVKFDIWKYDIMKLCYYVIIGALSNIIISVIYMGNNKMLGHNRKESL
jgi:hypothetical protein